MHRIIEWGFGHATGEVSLDAPSVSVGGYPVQSIGSPCLGAHDGFRTVRFDGGGDGLLVDMNPIEGFHRFSIEIEFCPESGGLREQRFFHIQEHGSENRVLLETRVTPDGFWYGDSFIKSPSCERFLNDPSRLHPLDRWYRFHLEFDGARMVQSIDGESELEARIDFSPLGRGQTSLGMRIDRRFWLKGSIGRMRIDGE